jgi:hypothetical protein
MTSAFSNVLNGKLRVSFLRRWTSVLKSAELMQVSSVFLVVGAASFNSLEAFVGEL